ncbi:hypothetical protein NDU88_004235 [Pleurodeles waltl]|uniref:Uncharacterized protein n=1 Tax=Pleurodeles waltl TaxID=8319 RepID=A0AAV7MUA8_PLEWA|nr:hypothetical protein NDU88_004235 [Pleurodeles waltl]
MARPLNRKPIGRPARGQLRRQQKNNSTSTEKSLGAVISFRLSNYPSYMPHWEWKEADVSDYETTLAAGEASLKKNNDPDKKKFRTRGSRFPPIEKKNHNCWDSELGGNTYNQRETEKVASKRG